MPVLPTCSVGYLKQLDERSFGSECTQQHELYCEGRVLQHEKHFSDYKDIINDGSVIILRKKCILKLQPHNASVFVSDHDSIGEIKALIQQRTSIPVNRQILFMRGTFQSDDHAHVLDPEAEEETYVVDSTSTRRLIAVEVPSHMPHAVVVNQSTTSNDLAIEIERIFGYAAGFQSLTVHVMQKRSTSPISFKHTPFDRAHRAE